MGWTVVAGKHYIYFSQHFRRKTRGHTFWLSVVPFFQSHELWFRCGYLVFKVVAKLTYLVAIIGGHACNSLATTHCWGWSGGAMVLGKLPVPGRPTNLIKSRARAYCPCSRCGWGLFRHFFSHLSFLSSFSLCLWETARYRLKYCLKGPLSPKATNQPTTTHCQIYGQTKFHMLKGIDNAFDHMECVVSYKEKNYYTPGI